MEIINTIRKSKDFLVGKLDPIVEKVKNIPSKYLIGTAAIALVGAGTLFALRGRDNSTDNYTGEYATNGVFSQLTNEGYETYPERFVIHGKGFYIEKIDEPQEGELGFRFLPSEETSRFRSLDSGKYRLEAETTYTPQRVEVEEFAVDRWADELNLGLRARILSQDELRRNVGAPENSEGFGGRDVAQYSITTMEIFGEEYFFPLVEPSEIGREGFSDFYLVPRKGGESKTSPDGELIIINENNIYRPRIPETSASLEESAEQAQTITGS